MLLNKKLLAISGGPREGGNADKMLNLAVKSAEEAGWQTNTIWLYDQNITWCKGCMKCKKSGVCIIQDDIVQIRDLLLNCNAVILSAPTYFANVPAIVKNLFDRLVGAIMDDNSSIIPKPKLSKGQKYLLMTTCNTPFPFNYLGGQSKGTIKAMNEFFHISGMSKMGVVVFAGTRNKTEIPASIQNKIKRYFK